MKREVCPNCGGVLVNESLGWKCKSCRGFISLQDGKFYEYVEKPLMPPQTNTDRIRAMSDEELAEFRAGSHCPPSRSFPDCATIKPCKECWLEYLKKHAKDGEGE